MGNTRDPCGDGIVLYVDWVNACLLGILYDSFARHWGNYVKSRLGFSVLFLMIVPEFTITSK